MVNHYYAPMRNRYAKNKAFPVETYQEFEWDGKSFLLTYVTEFYDRWMDAYAYGGATHHAGIMRLIHTLPSPWSEWTAQAAVSYTWYQPPKYTPRGDLVGLMQVLLPAMAAAVDGPPLHPPVQKYSPGAARRMKYLDAEEPHVTRIPRRTTLRMRTSAPLRIEREVEEMIASIPSSDEEKDEEMEPAEKGEGSNTESVGEPEEPEEDENGDE